MQSMCHTRANICSNLVECCVMWAQSFQVSGSRSLSGTCSRAASKGHEVAASRVLGVWLALRHLPHISRARPKRGSSGDTNSVAACRARCTGATDALVQDRHSQHAHMNKILACTPQQRVDLLSLLNASAERCTLLPPRGTRRPCNGKVCLHHPNRSAGLRERRLQLTSCVSEVDASPVELCSAPTIDRVDYEVCLLSHNLLR